MLERIILLSVTVNVIILILKLLKTVNRAYLAKWRCYLWLALSIRLLLPISISFPEKHVRIDLPDTHISSIYFQAIEKVEQQNAAESKPDLPDHRNNPFRFIWIVWTTGSIIFFTYHIVRYNLFRKVTFRWSIAMCDQRILNIYKNVAGEIGIRNPPILLINENAAGPLILGFTRTALIIPRIDYSEEEIQSILKHELTHLKRFDLWYKLLILIVNALYWFNPIVYLMRHEAYQDLELACDDEVIKSASLTEKRKYGGIILKTISNSAYNCTLSTSFHGNFKKIKDRLIYLQKPVKGKCLTILCSMIVLTGLLCTLIACNVVKASPVMQKGVIPDVSGINPLTSDRILETTPHTIVEENKAAKWISFPYASNFEDVTIIETAKAAIEMFYGVSISTIDTLDFSFSNDPVAGNSTTILPDALTDKLQISFLSERDDLLYTVTFDINSKQVTGVETLVPKSKIPVTETKIDQYASAAIDMLENRFSLSCDMENVGCFVPSISGQGVYDREVYIVFYDSLFYISLQAIDLSLSGYFSFTDSNQLSEFLTIHAKPLL